MAKKKSSKQRADFRKKYQGRVRKADLTRQFKIGDQDDLADAVQSERVSGKGELTRRRTVAGVDKPESDSAASVSDDLLMPGRVISVHGLKSRVLGEDGKTYECAIRQVLKSLSIQQRGAVVAGDRVRFRAESPSDGMIERIEERTGIINRTSRGQQHILVANVDYLMIVVSAAQPSLKPVLVDRFLLTAQQCEVQPIIVINKIDLVDLVEIQPLLGTYAAMGYRVLLTSVADGTNIDYLREFLQGNQTAVAGQSGVGKSSLLNAIEPGLGLAVREVSRDNDKGRHTTTASTLIPLENGGAVFDTPGIRQFQLWDISAEEVAGLMPDLRPYVSSCRYPNCLHLNEDECAVKNAVADSRIDARRYDAYCHLLENDLLL
jgi:ribosome biogenesis GTPase